MISKRAAEHLAQEYRDTQAQLITIENSIVELEAKREAQRMKLAWLESAIGKQSDDPSISSVIARSGPTGPSAGSIISSDTALHATARTIGTASAHVTTDSTILESNENGTAHGLRYSIRAVLRSAARGMRPRDVHSELVRRGMEFSEGKSSPLIRIYNELYRMSKVGQIRKRGALYYPQDTIQ